MWRVLAASMYRLFLAVLLVLNVLILSAVVVFMLGIGGVQPQAVTVVLAVCVLVAAVINGGLVLYNLVFVAFTNWLDERQAKHQAEWIARWLAALDETQPLPTGPLPPVALDALAEIHRQLKGTAAERIATLVATYQAEPYWQRQLRWYYPSATRINALEKLAYIGTWNSLPAIRPCYRSGHREVRLAALQTAARILARASVGKKGRILTSLADALARPDVPLYVLEDVCISLKELQGDLIHALLKDHQLSDEAHALLLRLVSRSKLSSLMPYALRHLNHRNPHIRAAALQVVARLGYVDAHITADIHRHLHDPLPQVRLQAIMAARQLPLEQWQERLWGLLADATWEVQLAAIETLDHYGIPGEKLLLQAAKAHPDDGARQLAARQLREHDVLQSPANSEWIWASV